MKRANERAAKILILKKINSTINIFLVDKLKKIKKYKIIINGNKK